VVKMKNALELINRLKEDFGCRLSENQIFDYLNSFEKRLCIEILKNTEFYSLEIDGDKQIELDFYTKDIVSVILNGVGLKKTTANKYGFHTDAKTLYIDIENPKGTLKIEHIAFPKEYSQSNCSSRDLLLAEGYEDVYVYHILSREALCENDIARLNNYSLLYSEAIASLKAQMQNNTEPKSEISGGSIRFNKIW